MAITLITSHLQKSQKCGLFGVHHLNGQSSYFPDLANFHNLLY